MMDDTLTPKSFQDQTGVSGDVLDRLRLYVELLAKWQRRINLVSASTLKDVWRRHILDSAQLHHHLPPNSRVLDLGSGAGFPGLVLAVMGGCHVQLVESDVRKCAFMMEARRVMGLEAGEVKIHNARIEELDPKECGMPDVVTSRALASLEKLLLLAEPFLEEKAVCLFLKGEKAEQELTIADNVWRMRAHRIPSLSNPSGVILHLSEITRHHD